MSYVTYVLWVSNVEFVLVIYTIKETTEREKNIFCCKQIKWIWIYTDQWMYIYLFDKLLFYNERYNDSYLWLNSVWIQHSISVFYNINKIEIKFVVDEYLDKNSKSHSSRFVWKLKK